MIRLIKRVLRPVYLLYLKKIKYRGKLRCSISTILDKNNYFEGQNFASSQSKIFSSHLGYATYVASNSIISMAHIGRFCCIGPNVSIIAGQHPINEFVSMHPAFYSLMKQAGFTYVNEQLFKEHRYVDSEEKYWVKIGNDVWIGDEVKIMEGVTIGDGAVIAAGAIVVKDVAPYSIVGGVPAKLLRYRFDEHKIEFLLKFKWWEKDENWIKENIQYFKNIDKFTSNFEI